MPNTLTEYHVAEESIVAVKHMTVSQVIREPLKKAEILRNDFHQFYFVALDIHIIDGVSLLGVFLLILAELMHTHHGINGTCHTNHHGNDGGNGSTGYTRFDDKLKVIALLDEE